MSGAWVTYVEARSPKRTLWRELDGDVVKGWRDQRGARVSVGEAEILRGPFDVTIVVRSPDVARLRRRKARIEDRVTS